MDDASPKPMPGWFHFGARAASTARLRELFAQMQAAGVAIVKPLNAGPTVVSFRCADPDGYEIEMYAAPD